MIKFRLPCVSWEISISKNLSQTFFVANICTLLKRKIPNWEEETPVLREGGGRTFSMPCLVVLSHGHEMPRTKLRAYKTGLSALGRGV